MLDNYFKIWFVLCENIHHIFEISVNYPQIRPSCLYQGVYTLQDSSHVEISEGQVNTHSCCHTPSIFFHSQHTIDSVPTILILVVTRWPPTLTGGLGNWVSVQQIKQRQNSIKTPLNLVLITHQVHLIEKDSHTTQILWDVLGVDKQLMVLIFPIF